MGFISSHKLLAVLVTLCWSTALWAVSQEDIERLEADMLTYFSGKDRAQFYRVTEKLKEVCKEAENDSLYYRTWGNQGIFEATLQNYQRAQEMAKEVLDDAKMNGSIYGEYAALHARAMILMQKQDYDEAETAFQQAVEYHHRRFPHESAAEDLQELMEIADHRRDDKAGSRYAHQILEEPNVAPLHKGRALYRLSQIAFNENNIREFNHIYNEMMKLKETDGIGALRPLVEVNHCIINKDFNEALRLAEQLDEAERAERKAAIYHHMGDDEKAYQYLLQHKRISDSITLVSHGNVVANCYVQMNNDRMQIEQHELERKNGQLRNRLYAATGFSLLLILLFFIWRGRKLIKTLRIDNKQLVYERKDAERALTDLNELSFYESKQELDLSLSLNPNQLCNRLSDYTQNHCHRNVMMVFQTDLPDDFEMKSNPEALRKLLGHLLNYAARFTHKGSVRLACADAGENIRFTVTDTSAGLGTKPKHNIIGMFADQGNKIRYVGMNFNICQSISRLLHGRIWYDAEYTHGTRFCFEMPKDALQLSVKVV